MTIYHLYLYRLLNKEWDWTGTGLSKSDLLCYDYKSTCDANQIKSTVTNLGQSNLARLSRDELKFGTNERKSDRTSQFYWAKCVTVWGFLSFFRPRLRLIQY